MKKLMLLLAAAFPWIFLPAQKIQWTWISGDSTGNKIDVYGNKRMLDLLNKPGCFGPQNAWTDSAGNLYMFQGSTLDIRLGFDTIPVFSNALWKYSPVVNTWAMITGANSTIPAAPYGGEVAGTPGLPAPGNTPGILLYNGTMWTDSAGKRWMYGGKDNYRDFGTKCQLWKFDPAIGQWTYVSGSSDDTSPSYGSKGVATLSNIPGARVGVSSWLGRKGQFYIYGGYCMLRHANYGDVWKFDTSLHQWTWVSGKQVVFDVKDAPVYGTSGVFAAGNTPGAASATKIGKPDSAGIVSMDVAGELWNFSVELDQWAWISGDRTKITTPAMPPRNYGIKGVPSISNNPGLRAGTANWTDSSGNLWTYGGYLTDAITNKNTYLNDLWKYSYKTGEWVWVDGDSTLNRRPDFGVKGMPSATSQPGGRSGAVTWKDANGGIWMFGGARSGNQASYINGTDRLNDLWKLSITNAVVPIKLSGFSAVQKDEQINLNWNTSQEQNSKEFIVERSPDGIRFTTIGTVAAAGNASAVSRYHFSDNAPLNGNNFYRLKQADLDNTFEYSAIAKVFVETASFTYMIMQNPVLNELRLVFKIDQAATVQIRILDATGHLIMERNTTIAQGTSAYAIPVKQLAAGVYFIGITTDKKTITKRFSK